MKKYKVQWRDRHTTEVHDRVVAADNMSEAWRQITKVHGDNTILYDIEEVAVFQGQPVYVDDSSEYLAGVSAGSLYGLVPNKRKGFSKFSATEQKSWDDYDEDDTVKQCQHEWKKDNYFSMKVYETCSHCGAKKEEL